MQVEIINPKAKKILKNLEELNLTAIKHSKVQKNGFADVLKKLRSSPKSAPSLAEITKEVELVRAKRYEEKSW
jgi:hypothetical protein